MKEEEFDSENVEQPSNNTISAFSNFYARKTTNGSTTNLCKLNEEMSNTSS